ncbi:MAG: Gfo/Idh/MocA family oxidoreductase [Clostridia bacterium]|nr:Gfo/Idh/MocA family oxidoreductase [Clostridia bacterium]
MAKIKIGVFGGGRGSSMIKFCKLYQDAELVAICDKYQEVLDKQKEQDGVENVTFYTNFEDFIKHDMDAVVLANYATEHAPYAIRCLNAGKHVFSEVLPCQTLKEAVELIETVEKTGKVYAYGENYCYMAGPREIRKLYKEGKLGEFEYGEGEYIHNCEPIWPDITYGEESHWRNNKYSTFYCTHSIGPIIHITGLRPVSVVGFEGSLTERNLRSGAKGAQFGIEMITLENGGIVKSVHGNLYKNSIWYSVYGSKGRAETAREDADLDNVSMLYVNADEYSGEYPKNKKPIAYKPFIDEKANDFGHSGSDYYTMLNFVKKINGDEDADVIDVYEALDMFLPGLMAYRSILDGSSPVKIPNLRDKAERDLYRNDVACTDKNIAGDSLLPTQKGGTPTIDKEVYQNVYKIWRSHVEDEKNKN